MFWKVMLGFLQIVEGIEKCEEMNNNKTLMNFVIYKSLLIALHIWSFKNLNNMLW